MAFDTHKALEQPVLSAFLRSRTDLNLGLSDDFVLVECLPAQQYAFEAAIACFVNCDLAIFVNEWQCGVSQDSLDTLLDEDLCARDKDGKPTKLPCRGQDCQPEHVGGQFAALPA